MNDQTQQQNRGSLVTVGAGAVGGASVAAGIFGALGLAKILANSDGNYAPGYPIVVFGMVALFILISAIAVAPISRQGAKFAWFGVLTFFALTAVGSIIFFMQTYNSPMAYVTANFTPDPTSFTDVNGDKKLQLVLQYRTRNGSPKYVPYADERIPISGHDVVELRLAGLDLLEQKYINQYRATEGLQKTLKLACEGVRDETCDIVNTQMSTDF